MPKPLFPTDKVRVVHSNDKTSNWYRAEVKRGEINVLGEISIEEGDILERPVPGRMERYRVNEATYYSPDFAALAFEGHWELRVEKQVNKPQPTVTTKPDAKVKPESRSNAGRKQGPPIQVHGNYNTVVIGDRSAIVKSEEAVHAAIEALRNEVPHIRKKAQRDDAEALIGILEGHMNGGQIRKGVVKSLLDGLPAVGQITSVADNLLKILQG